MGYTTIESVASFSVVLGEAFAAVAMSTLVPATFVTVTRATKAAIEAAADETARAAAAADGSAAIGALIAVGPAKKALDVVVKAASASTGIDLLIPKTAKIHAEFEFQGSETYSGEAGLGVQVEVVNVKAGYSALYSSTSKNKITLDVDFALAHYDV